MPVIAFVDYPTSTSPEGSKPKPFVGMSQLLSFFPSCVRVSVYLVNALTLDQVAASAVGWGTG